jgi:ferredoxin
LESLCETSVSVAYLILLSNSLRTMTTKTTAALCLASAGSIFFATCSYAYVLAPNRLSRLSILKDRKYRPRISPLFSDKVDYVPNQSDSDEYNPNQWIETNVQDSLYSSSLEDWDKKLSRENDPSYWSSFEGLDTSDSDEKFSTESSLNSTAPTHSDDGGEEDWLDTLASITADEINFMSKEADRADKVRQMQEMGFSSESISATLGVATDDELERDLDNKLYEAFKEETAKTGFGLYIDDDEDLQTVESHTKVEWDDELDEPVRSQMVYVDEVTCIGCTNCATIAQSTFFMESEHGRARVFSQWGDDDETIQTAIMTCPVDCIHYVPYDELKRLEIERRDQNINFKARLVNQGEFQASVVSQTRYGGSKSFSNQQQISGNMGSRCNNCPTRGCANCPMYGVGKNPEFQKKEAARKERLQKAAIKKRLESGDKRAEL